MIWIIALVLIAMVYYNRNHLRDAKEHFNFNRFQLPQIPREVEYPSQTLYTSRHIPPPTPFQSGHVDRLLQRQYRPGHQIIQKVRPNLTTGLDYCDDVTLGTCRGKISSTFKDPPMSCLPREHPIYPTISERQPYIYEKCPQIELNDHYRDWRYPREPIPLKFLANPHGYCQAHPQRYPCYVRQIRFDVRDRKDRVN